MNLDWQDVRASLDFASLVRHRLPWRRSWTSCWFLLISPAIRRGLLRHAFNHGVSEHGAGSNRPCHWRKDHRWSGNCKGQRWLNRCHLQAKSDGHTRCITIQNQGLTEPVIVVDGENSHKVGAGNTRSYCGDKDVKEVALAAPSSREASLELWRIDDAR